MAEMLFSRQELFIKTGTIKLAQLADDPSKNLFHIVVIGKDFGRTGVKLFLDVANDKGALNSIAEILDTNDDKNNKDNKGDEDDEDATENYYRRLEGKQVRALIRNTHKGPVLYGIAHPTLNVAVMFNADPRPMSLKNAEDIAQFFMKQFG